MFTLINNLSGSTHGRWNDYYCAETFRNNLDDWFNWSVIKIDEI